MKTLQTVTAYGFAPCAIRESIIRECSSMRIMRIVSVGLACAVVAACSGGDTGPTTTSIPPLAYVRYVNAMPDTGSVDVHLVDVVENLNFQDPVTGINTYGFVSSYTGIKAGNRHFRVFTDMGSNDITVVSQVILDTTLTLTANTYYTILHTGYARTGAQPHQKFVVIQDTPPSPSNTQVAIRAFVAAPGFGAVDVYAPTSTTGTTPAAASFSGVAYGTPSSYVNFATGSLALRAFNAGTTAPTLVQTAAPAGAAQQTYLDPVAGTTIGGSGFTAFIFPAGVAGSPQGSKAASIVYAVDKRPPRQ